LRPVERHPRPTREDVRRRLIEGALEAFAERGFMGSSIDFICSRAGFSRGAFYSNFPDKDALFFALYERQAAFIQARIERGLARLSAVEGAGGPRAVLAVLREVLAESDPDELRWDIVNKEFIVHALRNDAARAQLVRHRAALRQRIVAGVRTVLLSLGMQHEVEVDEIARLIIALHEGDLTQRGLEPEERAGHSLEARFIPLVLTALAAGKRAADA
jgi:AcrR family transcriptional regulator